MALGKKCDSRAEGGLGFNRCRTALGTKRVVIWDAMEGLTIDSAAGSPPKKQRGTEKKLDEPSNVSGDWSLLQSLPQDILIKVVCGVNHDDLKQLFQVSKPIRQAALIAKESHFAYSTPSKTKSFRSAMDLENPSDTVEVEAPNAPKQARGRRSRIGQKKMSDIVVALFASPGEDACRERGGLLTESEV